MRSKYVEIFSKYLEHSYKIFRRYCEESRLRQTIRRDLHIKTYTSETTAT